MNNDLNTLDTRTQQQLATVLADYGLTIPQAFQLFANQVVKTGVVPLSFDWHSKVSNTINDHTIHDKTVHKLSQNGERLLRESIDDFERGDYTSYASLEALNQAMKEIAHD